MKPLIWITCWGVLGSTPLTAEAQFLVKPFIYTEFEAQVHKVKIPIKEDRTPSVTVNVGNLFIEYFIDAYSPYLNKLSYAAIEPEKVRGKRPEKQAFLFNVETRANGSKWIKKVRPLEIREISEAQKSYSNDEFEALLTSRYSYTPTVTRDSDIANHFRSLEDFLFKQKLEECYRRAHLWSYSLDTNFGVKGFKVFIFYTRSMTAPIDKNWWFHVAPMYRVERTLPNGQKKIEEIVLDNQFPRDLGKPVTVDQWVAKFSKKTPCRYTNDFYDFFNHQFSAQCYVMKVPMYYYGPTDLELITEGARLKSHPRKNLNMNQWNFEDLVESREKVKIKFTLKNDE